MTAAHCFDGIRGDYLNGYQMKLGTADLKRTDEGAVRNIADYKIHPDYVETRAYYDVGIAIANQLIPFTNDIRPVNLPMRPIDDSNGEYFDGNDGKKSKVQSFSIF